VKGLSQLYRDTDTFIAGSTEQGFKRNLSNPSSLSSNGHSASPQQQKRLQKARKKPREEPSGMCLVRFIFWVIFKFFRINLTSSFTRNYVVEYILVLFVSVTFFDLKVHAIL